MIPNNKTIGVVQIKVTLWVESQNLKTLAHKDLKDLLSSTSVTLIPRFLNHAIEGTCRHLINDRLDRTGARWSLKGAEALLKLRSLYASGDLEDYWTFHERQEQQRNHTSRYANQKLPQLQTPNYGATGSRHLHLVR